MSIQLEGFKVAAVYSEDLEKSIGFYTNALGFEKMDEGNGGAHLKLERGEKSIVIYVQGGYPADRRAADVSKISLVFDTASVKAAAAKVESLGLPVSLPYREMGAHFAMLAILDPSGNQIMLMGAP